MDIHEFAEIALLDVLVAQPGRVSSLRSWLAPQDFAHPEHAALFAHLDELVTHAQQQVRWGDGEHDLPDASGSVPDVVALLPVETEAQRVLHEVRSMSRALRDMREYPADWAGLDIEREQRERADRIAASAAAYPGLLDRLTDADRAEIEAVLPLTTRNAYAVAGVDAAAVWHRAHGDTVDTAAWSADRARSPALSAGVATATSPPPQGRRVQRYGLMVLEAAIRRRVEQAGLQVLHATTGRPDLRTMVTTVELALSAARHAEHRWEQAHQHTTMPSSGHGAGLDAGEEVGVDGAEHRRRPAAPVQLTGQAPDSEQIRTAETAVVGHLLATPELVETFQRMDVQPRDFADPLCANTYRAAVELFQRGEPVDAVTIAGQQQRSERQHGRGLPVERIQALRREPGHGDPRGHAETVLRGSVHRLTEQAARAVRQAAAHPGVVPTDLLHTTQLAYQAVRTSSERICPARLAALSFQGSVCDALHQAAAGPGSHAATPTSPTPAAGRVVGMPTTGPTRDHGR